MTYSKLKEKLEVNQPMKNGLITDLEEKLHIHRGVYVAMERKVSDTINCLLARCINILYPKIAMVLIHWGKPLFSNRK